MAQGGNILFGHIPADAALVLGAAVGQAGGGYLGAFHQQVVVLVGVRLEMGGQDHTAGVGIGRHGECDGGTAVTAAGTGRPTGKDESFVGNGCDGAGGTALFDQLAGRTGQLAAVGGHKFQRNSGAAYGNGVFGDQVGRYAVRGGNGAQRLGTAVLRYIGVGAHIVKIGGNGYLGKMHPVRKGVVGLGPAGGAVPQDLGTVQKLETVFLTHLYQGGIVGVHLNHGQVGVFPLLVQRRNGADNDVAVRPGLLNGLQSLQIGGNETGGIGGGTAQIVGAVADDDPLGLQHGHRFRNGVHFGRPLEFLAGQRGDGAGPHAHHADVVVQ